MPYNGWRYAVVIFYGLKERIMKQRNLIDYTVWLQQKGFIKSDVVIEALTSEYAEQLSTEAVKNNAVLPLVSVSVCARCGAKTKHLKNGLCYGCTMLKG